MDQGGAEAYLQRISATRPDQPDDEGLRQLHAAHLMAVPFENLSIPLGEPVLLDEESLFDKIVLRRRGGFCYELNGAFATLLSAMGFDVALLAARVFSRDGVGPPFDHLVLQVGTTERWFADVGFGRHSLYPLRLDDRTAQLDPGGTFTIVDAGQGDVDVVNDGAPQYRVEMRPRRIVDFEPMCWWHQTSPRSHFTRSLTCSLPTPSGRVTLSDRRLIETVGGDRWETALTDDSEILAAYRAHFGVVLDRAPHLPPTIESPGDQAPDPSVSAS